MRDGNDSVNLVGNEFGLEAGVVLKPARVMKLTAGVLIALLVQRVPAMVGCLAHDGIHLGASRHGRRCDSRRLGAGRVWGPTGWGTSRG